MNDYYGGGWSAQKLRVYFWLLVAAVSAVIVLDWLGVIEVEKPQPTQQQEPSRE
ncbi:hypothetical protein [uncultured Hymenobacter sp.]|uniref:hypothetical protein n=1 Tax=uncultured Hymenobacter sp. TaxID=170016 RepID=UPI0035CBCDBD